MPTDSEKVLSERMRDLVLSTGRTDIDSVDFALVVHEVATLESTLASRTERVAALTDALTEIARIVHAPRSYGYDITHSARVQELTKPFHDGKLPAQLSTNGGK